MVSVSMVLFLVGLLGLMVINTNRFTNYLKENVIITVYFSPAAPEERLTGILADIRDMKIVSSSSFTSKEQAAEDYKKELDYDFEETLDMNPLPASLDIFIDPETTDSAAVRAAIDQIREMDFVQDVEYLQDLVSSINAYKDRISFVLLGISIILIIISIILITNTVRLSVYANRFLVKSMQLVGATEWFIVRPFVVRAIWIGTLGAIMAVILLLVAMFAGANWVVEAGFVDTGITGMGGAGKHGEPALSDRILVYWKYFLKDMSQYSILFVSLFILGIAILVISTYVSTKKYLKLKIDDLY